MTGTKLAEILKRRDRVWKGLYDMGVLGTESGDAKHFDATLFKKYLMSGDIVNATIKSRDSSDYPFMIEGNLHGLIVITISDRRELDSLLTEQTFSDLVSGKDLLDNICDHCGKELGDTAWASEGKLFCSQECVGDRDKGEEINMNDIR